MKKGLTELVFILDRSGSMHGLEQDTIGGFNNMVDKQKKLDGDVIVTTVLFDNKYELIHDRFDIKAVSEMTEKEYYVRGCTALLDAMGSTIQKTINVQNHLPESEQAEHVIVVTITDGLENASCEYSYDDVKKMIEAQTEKGWEFMFLGANIDAVTEAKRFGIKEDRAVRYESDGVGTAMNYDVVSEAVEYMRDSKHTARMGSGWKKRIEEHYNKSRK